MVTCVHEYFELFYVVTLVRQPEATLACPPRFMGTQPSNEALPFKVGRSLSFIAKATGYSKKLLRISLRTQETKIKTNLKMSNNKTVSFPAVRQDELMFSFFLSSRNSRPFSFLTGFCCSCQCCCLIVARLVNVCL